MSLTDEIMGMASDFGHAQYMSGSTHSVAWMREVVRTRKALRTRLTALETELEGYRKREALWQLTTTAQEQGEYQGVGRSEGGMAECDREQVPSDLAVPHPIPDSEPRISGSSGMALPCESEYVNAQSDITGEDLG